MPKPHPIELRKRVVAHVEEGHSHRSTARHFCVSIKFVNDMVKLKRETGALVAQRCGSKCGHGKLAPYAGWLLERVNSQGDVTLHALSFELEKTFGVQVHHWSIGRLLHKSGLSHKKRQLSQRNNNAKM